MLFDSIIIGGGPAGLTAAIYLARYNRSVLVIDRHNGRWNTFEKNENYFGFPKGILTRTLRERGLFQAEKYGADYLIDYVHQVKKDQDGTFLVIRSDDVVEHAKSVIFATGVIDNFPHFDQWKQYVGKSMFWCITCDGYKTIDKKLVVIGHNDDAVCSGLQFLNFTSDITFVTDEPLGTRTISRKWLDNLKKASVPFIDAKIVDVHGKDGTFTSIDLSNGETISLDILISEQGSVPNSNIAKDLGVNTNEKGSIIIDEEQHTNQPFVYAAGDVTDKYSHQIGTAVHEGSQAADSANYDLYLPFQKM